MFTLYRVNCMFTNEEAKILLLVFKYNAVQNTGATNNGFKNAYKVKMIKCLMWTTPFRWNGLRMEYLVVILQECYTVHTSASWQKTIAAGGVAQTHSDHILPHFSLHAQTITPEPLLPKRFHDVTTPEMSVRIGENQLVLPLTSLPSWQSSLKKLNYRFHSDFSLQLIVWKMQSAERLINTFLVLNIPYKLCKCS